MLARQIVFALSLVACMAPGCGSEMSDREQILAERQQLRAEYGALFDEIAAILFELDPVGINFESNTDEYEPEVGTILPRLRSCSSVADARRVIHEEFVRWFEPETAGPESNYQEAAERIWAAWERHQSE
jgi:hypothetical protein